jgi:hypothetical protein
MESWGASKVDFGMHVQGLIKGTLSRIVAVHKSLLDDANVLETYSATLSQWSPGACEPYKGLFSGQS